MSTFALRASNFDDLVHDSADIDRAEVYSQLAGVDP
jgi:hypothetical protein